MNLDEWERAARRAWRVATHDCTGQPSSWQFRTLEWDHPCRLPLHFEIAKGMARLFTVAARQDLASTTAWQHERILAMAGSAYSLRYCCARWAGVDGGGRGRGRGRSKAAGRRAVWAGPQPGEWRGRHEASALTLRSALAVMRYRLWPPVVRSLYRMRGLVVVVRVRVLRRAVSGGGEARGPGYIG